MDEEKNAPEAEAEEAETPEAELAEITDWEAEAKKARGIAQRLRTKLTKATEAKKLEPVEPVKKASEIDDTETLVLEVKGITEDDEVALYERWKSETNRKPREILNNKIFKEELQLLRKEREVKNAIPSSSRRAGAGGDALELAVSRYEQSGFDPKTLPDDFDLRAKVVNAMVAKANPNKPSWH